MNKSYLIVFHGNYELLRLEKKIIDITDDPCFDEIPTWGICRPPTRKWITIGDKLFFIGYYKELNEYYLKGWFEVGEKISYDDALKRFPHRKNVIISKGQRQENNIKWRYKKLEEKYKSLYPNEIPDWLISIETKEGKYYQNRLDNHEIDNWKCRRIFHCPSTQFLKCISNNKCEKNDKSLSQYKNYIVSHPFNWKDIGNKLIKFKDFSREMGCDIKLKTPRGQHNVLSINTLLIEFLNQFQIISNT